MNLMKHGRKWLALQITMVTVYVVLVMSFILALSQKLTGDWSALMSVLLAATAGATAMFMQTNSSITKKAMEEGAPPPEG
jgi:Kef-type K+ transport system membrane component KefB